MSTTMNDKVDRLVREIRKLGKEGRSEGGARFLPPSLQKENRRKERERNNNGILRRWRLGNNDGRGSVLSLSEIRKGREQEGGGKVLQFPSRGGNKEEDSKI